MIRFILLVFTLLTAPALFAASDCTLARYQKSLLSIRLEDFSDPSQLKFCGPSDAGSLGSIFLSVYNMYEVRDLTPTKEQREAVWNQIDSIKKTQHSLVRVGSDITDLLSDRQIQMTGVGSVIGVMPSGQKAKEYSDLSYYVLTASHVVAGANPFIEINGKKIATKIIKIDYEKDLALLDFSSNQQILPLGILNNGVINTPFYFSTKQSTIYDIKTGRTLQTLRFEPWVESDPWLPASVLAKAPWLTDTPIMNMKKALQERFKVPRAREESMIAPGAFAQGFSGTPLLATYRLREKNPLALDPEYAYVIGGILTLSTQIDRTESAELQTISTSISQIHDFLNAPNKKASDAKTLWVLVGPYFMKWSEQNEQGLIYTGPGPIGNGVVVEGRQANPTGLEGTQIKEIFKNLQTANSPEEKMQNILKFESKIKLTKPLTNSQLIKDLEKYKLDGLKN